MKIEVTSPRPLAEVARVIEQRFGSIVTYEEPPYAHPDDLTHGVDGQIIPRGGRMVIEYQTDDTPYDLLQKSLAIHRRSGFPGSFTIEQSQDYYHIVPSGFQNTHGIVEKYTPLLETWISLSSQPRTALQFIEDVVQAVTIIRKQQIKLGTLPVNALAQHTKVDDLCEGKAGELLIRLYREMGRPLSWQLFNNPTKAEFFLNIHQVSHSA